MAPGEPPRGPIRPFARSVVGLGLVEDPEPAALFRKLRDHDFLPDPLAHEAIRALAGQPVVDGSLLLEAVAEAEERRLLAEVDRFAAEFFDRDVPARVERHRELVEVCKGHPRLVERLKALQPGLTIDRSADNDPSPPVHRLIVDVLDLFPLRPEVRAAEARERAERFRTDPKLTDADRARALKVLRKLHPEIIALLPDHPAQLVKVRRRAPADRFGTKVVTFVGSLNHGRYWFIAVVLLSSIGRLFTTSSSNPTRPSNLASRINQLPTADPKRLAEAIVRSLRDGFKASIRRELERAGKPIDPPRLHRIVARLPVEQLPPIGDMDRIRADGLWIGPVRDRFIARLKQALKEANLGLTDAELDDLAPRCFPEASTPVKP